MNRPMADELRAAFRRRRVLVTGHSGFKGGWLALWLAQLEAEVTGLALAPNTDPALFEDARLADVCHSVIGDIRDRALLRRVVREFRPELVFHLAAQPLVRLSYEEPLETLETNVVGTANVLEALRAEACKCAVVVVTSDKCYENREWVHGYRETDPVGGHDVYSMSKGSAELVVESWRRCFFPPSRLQEHGVAVASARAGNVIGGGDWARDRVVPDTIRSLLAHRPVALRNPEAVRPWQHVLEPLGGYLLLAQRLLGGDGARYCGAWNFGPLLDSARPVRQLVDAMVTAWGTGSWVATPIAGAPHEAGLLRLSIEKAHAQLGWSPRWDLARTAQQTAAWYRAHAEGVRGEALRAVCLRQVEEYLATGAGGAA